jgi:hypothetical protein
VRVLEKKSNVDDDSDGKLKPNYSLWERVRRAASINGTMSEVPIVFLADPLPLQTPPTKIITAKGRSKKQQKAVGL